MMESRRVEPESILYLVPQYEIPAGGLEVYTRQSWEILKSYAALRGMTVRCLAFKDQGPSNYLKHRIGDGEVLGCNGSKLGFVLRATLCALKYPNSLLIVGHIRQSPVAWLLRKLRLTHSHSLLIYGYEAWGKLALLQGLATHKARSVITISKYTASQFGKYNSVPLKKIEIVPPSLPEAAIAALPGTRREDSEVFRVLSVGRLQKGHELKGFDQILKSMVRVKAAGREFHLNIVGDGDDLGRLQNLAESLGVARNVTFLGRVSNQERTEQYKRCDVFVLPSQKEGFGIVFTEAMSFGKPCIGGDNGGTPEVIEHGITGYLVGHEDVKQLSRYLVRLSDSPELCKELGRNGYQKVLDCYTFASMKSKWFNVLDKLIEG